MGTLAWSRIRVEPDVEIALSAEFRVVTFDPRSHGRSTHTRTGNTYPQQGRDLAAIIAVLGLGPVHLVGWSYGALAAYAYIEQSDWPACGRSP